MHHNTRAYSTCTPPHCRYMIKRAYLTYCQTFPLYGCNFIEASLLTSALGNTLGGTSTSDYDARTDSRTGKGVSVTGGGTSPKRPIRGAVSSPDRPGRGRLVTARELFATEGLGLGSAQPSTFGSGTKGNSGLKTESSSRKVLVAISLSGVYLLDSKDWKQLFHTPLGDIERCSTQSAIGAVASTQGRTSTSQVLHSVNSVLTQY